MQPTKMKSFEREPFGKVPFQMQPFDVEAFKIEPFKIDMTANSATDVEPSTTLESQNLVTKESASHPKATREGVEELDWESSNINPHNWPMYKRIYHALIPATFGFVVTFSSSVYTPAVPEVALKFQVSTTAAILPFSLFVFGLGFGPVLAAPLSEKYGRHVTYAASLPVFALFILGAGLSQNFASLLICRLLAGLFGSPPLSVGAGTNTDLWEPKLRAVMSSLYCLCPYLGPALGPVIGGFAVVRKGWRWTQWTILFFAIAAYALGARTEETYKKTILRKRAKSLGLEIPKGPTGLAALKFLLHLTFFRPLTMLVSEPIVIAWSWYIAFNFAVLYSFFAAFPLIFSSIYKFDIEQTGLTFLAIGVGCILATITVIFIDRLIYRKHLTRSKLQDGDGLVAPEHRLYSAMIGSTGIPVGLFWFAWTARKEVHWMSPVAAAVPFAWGNLCVFMSGFLYIIDTYESLTAASAMAANSLLRYTLAAVFPLFIDQMYRGLGVGKATSLLGAISLGLLPIPWVLFHWGPKIRAKSTYDTIKA